MTNLSKRRAALSRSPLGKVNTAMTGFAEELVRYRKRLGMAQQTLAERSGLTPSHLNRIEKGTRKPPPVANLLPMIAALHLSRREAEDLVRLAGYDPLVLLVGT